MESEHDVLIMPHMYPRTLLHLERAYIQKGRHTELPRLHPHTHGCSRRCSWSKYDLQDGQRVSAWHKCISRIGQGVSVQYEVVYCSCCPHCNLCQTYRRLSAHRCHLSTEPAHHICPRRTNMSHQDTVCRPRHTDLQEETIRTEPLNFLDSSSASSILVVPKTRTIIQVIHLSILHLIN